MKTATSLEGARRVSERRRRPYLAIFAGPRPRSRRWAPAGSGRPSTRGSRPPHAHSNPSQRLALVSPWPAFGAFVCCDQSGRMSAPRWLQTVQIMRRSRSTTIMSSGNGAPSIATRDCNRAIRSRRAAASRRARECVPWSRARRLRACAPWLSPPAFARQVVVRFPAG
jgi:hypothetical protein